ncbi:hypothetical protein Cgig2_000664 [Carnegiea gigantea]|uniref:Retrovirus-related Pol polyprotein from transposon TNT 1-94-like beta-barrel domain-containing protein n=1 Tax=Carnegiea gigantea TaxID=171969 RepID=A0A9Q1GPK7_9CARY|nr:hypothetical protein Cgig2_000664 [Carnegiea gigantea]
MQREILNHGRQVQYEILALYSNGNEEKCGVCGNKEHSKEKCWQVIGYPSWHPGSKNFPQKKLSKPVKNYKGKENHNNTVAAAQSKSDNKQLLKLIPQQHKTQRPLLETDDELEQSITGNVFCACSSFNTCEWIIDTRATDPITPNFEDLQGVQLSKIATYINMPNGSKAKITDHGCVPLKNGLRLENTLCVPSFKYRLLSVSRLVKDNDCVMTFYPEFCIVQDLHTKKIKGFGREQGGLYYLSNVSVKE